MRSTLRAVTTICVLSLVFDIISCCARVPQGIPHGRKGDGDNGYRIIIGDEPTGYQPGKIYNLFLLGSRTHGNLQQFTHFTLNAQTSSTSLRESAVFRMASPKKVGRFQLFSDALTKFNEDCVNTVSEADDLAKTEIQVMWVAPSSGSGCVALSAMVYEGPSSWYADAGKLTKIICEDTEIRTSAPACCACDEAKYNFVFEGIWSNETHPRDYPFAVWLTHFSDVIGASHETNFSFWGENHISTDGFRSLAEWGSVRALETELRAKGPKLRTLIKAAGLWYPNVNQNTSSQFRVDRQHHKLSLVSMFGPSPDWVVGVSGLNLCQSDCTWKNRIDIDLYPWDAGTDNGITYMSPNQETQPRERMYKITTMYPEDPRQPFYGLNKMIPLARLYIRREKIISRNCDDTFLQSQILDVSENTEEGQLRPQCETTEFSSWTPCSVTCGKGIRMRSREYKNANLAQESQCNRQLINKEMCVADIPECETQTDEPEENLAESQANTDDAGEGIGVCKTTKWSEWSPCSATCGIGISMRTRTFIDHVGRKKCPHVSIVEKQKCMQPECSFDQMEVPDALCSVTTWSDWSPCSATCGRGIRIRTRLLLTDPSMMETCSKRLLLNQQESCSNRPTCLFDPQAAREICAQAAETGPCRGAYNRFAYDKSRGTCISFMYGGCRGNQNNFLTLDECSETCRHSRDTPLSEENPIIYNKENVSPRSVDCVVTEWTDWTPCSTSCGMGTSDKYRRIVTEASNGGVACPKKLSKRKRCFQQC